MVGRLCDVSELTETGRFIPWIRKMKYPFCLVTVICFAIRPTSSNDGEDCLYFCFIHCLWDFSLNNQYPYGAMAAAISSNPNDRTSLSTFRSIGSAIGGSTTGFFIPILMYTITRVDNKSFQGIISFGFNRMCCNSICRIYVNL